MVKDKHKELVKKHGCIIITHPKNFQELNTGTLSSSNGRVNYIWKNYRCITDLYFGTTWLHAHKYIEYKNTMGFNKRIYEHEFNSDDWYIMKISLNIKEIKESLSLEDFRNKYLEGVKW